MTKGRTTLIQNDPSNITAPNNHRPITCLPVIWKIFNSRNKGIDLLLANKPRFVSRRTERMLKGSRDTAVTLHRSTHPKWEQYQSEKSSYCVDWRLKGIWHGSAKLDNKLPQNVQNTTWSPKLYRGNYENLESGIDSRCKKLRSKVVFSKEMI